MQTPQVDDADGGGGGGVCTQMEGVVVPAQGVWFMDTAILQLQGWPLSTVPSEHRSQ